MISSFYSARSGSIVQYSPAGGAKTTQITAKGSEVETSDGLSVHIDRRAHREVVRCLYTLVKCIEISSYLYKGIEISCYFFPKNY